MAQAIQHLRGTADQWAVNDIVIPHGEMGFLLDVNGEVIEIRIGNGVDVWSALLPFFSPIAEIIDGGTFN